MISRKLTLILAGALAISALAGCQSVPASVSPGNSGGTTNAAISLQPEATESPAAATVAPAAETAEATPAAQPSATADSAVVAQAEESATQEDSAAETAILLDDTAITVEGSGVQVDGAAATITAAGVYNISGALADGQIVVDTADEGVVQLVLNGARIHNSTNAPIAVLNAAEVVIVLADGSENHLSDGESYSFADPAEDEPNAALFSKVDLAIDGEGALTVDANYNDGIASKDGLVIRGGVLTVSAADDGIRGKDYLAILDGSITVDAGGDGLKSDNEEDPALGYIAIESGALTVTAGGDAIQAQTTVQVSGGEFTLTSGGGSTELVGEDDSAKGIKGDVSVIIDGGEFTIDAADDGIHSNGDVTINQGALVIASGDDGVHADGKVEINGGEVQVTRSVEGIEGSSITINDGNVHVTSSDDGVNVAGDNDGTGRPPGPGQEELTYTGDQWLTINGGRTVVVAQGDGIDVNGAIEMTGGVVIVHGPTANNNGALDYDGTFQISGGLLIAAGSAGMAQAPSTRSPQFSLLINYPSTVAAGTLAHIASSDGEEILTFAPLKNYQSIVFSSPQLENGATYDLYYGGSSTGDDVDGLIVDGAYSPGTEVATFTINSAVTRIQ